MYHPNERQSLFLLETDTLIFMSGNNIVLKQTVKKLCKLSQMLEYTCRCYINRPGRACILKKKKILYRELFCLSKVYLTFLCLHHYSPVIHHYTLSDITDKCIVGCQMDKERRKNGIKNSQ